jgi:S-(hydroxymethyl)glutathione dehydrogenase/alcohol dehydrogenase
VVGAYSGVGTHATAQVVAAEAAIPVHPATPVEVAALIGCAATTGVGAVRHTARVKPGERAVVIGLGGVGLAAVIAAHEAGARVVGVDPEPSKRALALEIGATAAIEPDRLERVATLLGGPPDHVLECIGLAEVVEAALGIVRPGGAVTVVGMTAQGSRAGVDVYRLVEDGKRLLGSNYGSAVPARDFPAIAEDVVAGRLPLGRLVTERIALDDLSIALDAMRRRDGARRVVVFDR